MTDLLINAAILHIFDYQSNQTIISDQTMNLDDSTIEKYIHKTILKCMQDLRNQVGYFHETSSVLACIKNYQSQQANFSDTTKQLSKKFQPFFQSTTKAYDLLCVDYTYDTQRYMGMYVLENQMAYTHLTKTNAGLLENTITKQSSLLPNTTKKLNAYANIDFTNFQISFVDTLDWKQDDVQVLKDSILDCTCEESKQEILQKVNDVVEEVALQVDSNPTLLLSKYKNYVKEAIEDELPITTEQLATNVFNETEEMQDTFLSSSLQHELPKEVEVPKQYISRKMKNQKIKTDTGIELTFPTEYSKDSNYIEFVRNEDGKISIEIKNIGEIINKG